MRSFRRFALLLALAFPAMHAVLAQSSSSNPPTPATGQDQAQQQAPDQTSGQQSVQARIRARREARRAAAIHDAYAHRYDIFTDMGYLRFRPGPALQRLTYYAWETGITRYYSERLGINVIGRGYYGTAYVGPNLSNIIHPAISQYDVLAGPTYRFYMQPRYSISGRVMGGWSLGNYSGDTGSFGGKTLGMYPDGSTFAISASAIAEYNLTPSVAFRLAAEDLTTGYGSAIQNSRGFTSGVVYRFGKQ